jgi:hypothetical protein
VALLLEEFAGVLAVLPAPMLSAMLEARATGPQEQRAAFVKALAMNN